MHANKIHRLFKPRWTRMHTACFEQHPWAKLCGSHLALMDYLCTQHVLRPKHRSLLVFPQDLLLAACQHLGPSNLTKWLRHFAACLTVSSFTSSSFTSRFPFLVSAPQTHKDFILPFISPLQGHEALERWSSFLWTHRILISLPSAFPVPPPFCLEIYLPPFW